MADTNSDLKEIIQKNAQGPARVSGDAGSIEQHRLSDLIAADRYLADKNAISLTNRGLRFNKFVAPGIS